MEIDEVLPPLPLEPPDDFGHDEGRAPPPPPLQTSSDAEVMDVSSGGDGYTHTPGDGEAHPQRPLSMGSLTFCSRLSEEANPNPPCPRTARHAPQVTKFLPDLKLLRDVKISVSFTESSSGSSSTSSKDRKVLYTGERQDGREDAGLGRFNGELHDWTEQEAAEGSSAAENAVGRTSEEADVDAENKVEYAVLDELEEYYDNFLDQDDGEHGGFKSEVIAQQEQADDDAVAFSYEVCLPFFRVQQYHLMSYVNNFSLAVQV